MMTCYETTTTLAPAVALAVAELFFSACVGLLVEERNAQELRLAGGGGYVVVQVIRERPTTLAFRAREWGMPVAEFVSILPR
jgi:hypothetical protein